MNKRLPGWPAVGELLPYTSGGLSISWLPGEEFPSRDTQPPGQMPMALFLES